MSENTSFILAASQMGFGRYGPEDELLHPEMNAEVVDDGATETQFFGFNVPEENIHGYGYFWHHPNLRTITGGIQAWQGTKTHHLASELYDMRAYQSDKMIEKDIDHYKMPSSYQLDVIKPFEEMRLQYIDELRQNAVDITYTAVVPPAMLPNRKHFEQTMRTKGSITLRGKIFPVDGYTIRDRSWGEVRPEEPVASPPAAWLTGVFGDDFCFNCMVLDHPSRAPEWLGIYEVPEEATLKGGWVYRDGEMTRIIRAEKYTKRNPSTLAPMTHEMEIEDENGKVYQLHGTLMATSPTGFWANCKIEIGLTRWECRGSGIDNAVGWGDSQEAQWTDFVHAMQNK